MACRSERGYSLLKMLVVLVVIGYALFQGVRIAGACYTNYKVQHCFDLLVAAMPYGSSAAARERLDDLFHTQYINRDDLPDEFYQQLAIDATGERLEISSEYSVTIWLLGRAAAANDEAGGGESANANFESEAGDWVAQWRRKAAIKLQFAPYAISTGGAGDGR